MDFHRINQTTHYTYHKMMTHSDCEIISSHKRWQFADRTRPKNI